MLEPRIYSANDLRVGLTAEFEREVTAADIASFGDLSHDWNPLHISESYAAQSNYGGRIVHGAFQVGLASAMAGMYLPGRDVVVGSFLCRFPAPLRYPSVVRVHGEITAWLPQSARGTLRVRVVELPTLILTAEVNVGFTLHESRSNVVQEDPTIARTADNRPIVLVTGATGGIGQHLIASLSNTYQVIGMSRSKSHAGSVLGTSIESVETDLSGEWEEAVGRQLHGRPLYAVVHSAWPTGPQGSLLDTDVDAIGMQVEFGSLTTIRIARFLRAQSAGPGRLVILGTTAGTLKPVLNLSAYSLGKAAMEHTVHLLAPELARSNITINVVSPSFVPVGMNSSKTNRVVLSEMAKVPLGRLCSPEDISSAVEFFLSSGAAFVTGQMMPLTGGQL